MKVLFVFSIGKLDGGAAAVWMNLLDGLPSRGVEPYVVVPQGPDKRLSSELDGRGIPWRKFFFTWWVTSDARPHSLGHRIRRRGARIVNRHAEGEIGKFIDEHGIELVYICDGTITAGLEAAKERGLPVVWHIHEFIREQPGGVSFIDPEMHVGNTLMKADKIIAVTKSIRTDLTQRFPGLRDGRIKAIYNGIPRSRICEKSGILDREQVVFTLVGRIDGNKGQEGALRAFIKVASDYPQARLHIVGAGDPELEARLRSMAEKCPFHDRIEFQGTRHDIARVWDETDVALNCSYTEGCSMVLCEAMSSGCLMLCSTAESNVELIDGKYGLLYERRKVDALAEKMRWVLEHGDEARVIAAAGKERAAHLFDLDRQIDAVYRVFEEVSR